MMPLPTTQLFYVIRRRSAYLRFADGFGKASRLTVCVCIYRPTRSIWLHARVCIYRPIYRPTRSIWLHARDGNNGFRKSII